MKWIRDWMDRKKGKFRSAIEQYLREKYREEFIIENIFWVDKPRGVKYKVEFSPVRNRGIKSQLTAKSKKKIIGDNYMNDFFSSKLELVLEELLQPVFQTRIVVFSFLWPLAGEEGWPSPFYYDTTMSLEEYLKGNIKDLEILLWIFAESQTEIDIDKEAQRINRVSDILLERSFANQDIDVLYLNPAGFEIINKERANKYVWFWQHDHELYEVHENCRGRGYILVNHGEKAVYYTDHIIDEIKHSFEEYKTDQDG